MAGTKMKQLKKELQNLVGGKPKVKVSKFVNWAKTQFLDEVLSVTPKTVQEVQSVIKGARLLGLHVRAVSGGYSWTPLFSDEGQVLMNVKDIQRPDGPPIQLMQDPNDPSNKFVTMATGVTVQQFKDFQLNHGVCFPTNVIARELTMGGVITTGCHGTGWDARGISDYVVSIRIVDSNGDLRTYSRKEDPDMMKAVQCNLGLWGIVIDFTLKVEPMFLVETHTQWVKMKDLFYNQEAMCELITTNWSVEIFWFPFNGMSRWEAFEAVVQRNVDYGDWDPMEDEIWVRIINNTESSSEEVGKRSYRKWDREDTSILQGMNLVDDFIIRQPNYSPSFLRTQVDYLKKMRNDGASVIEPLPHAIHFLNDLKSLKVREMEFAFSLDKDCSNLMTSIQEVVKLIRSEALEGRFPMNLSLEMRFIADSDAYLSPSVCANPHYGGSGHTCYIEVATLAGTQHWLDFCQKVANVWQRQKGARPHWCKEWQHLNGIEEFIRKSYKPQLSRFLLALEESGVDPDGMFFNDTLERIFYPGGHPGKHRGRVVNPVNMMQPSHQGLMGYPIMDPQRAARREPVVHETDLWEVINPQFMLQPAGPWSNNRVRSGRPLTMASQMGPWINQRRRPVRPISVIQPSDPQLMPTQRIVRPMMRRQPWNY